MPFSNLEIVTEELLEAELFGVGKVSLLEALLPLGDKVKSIWLCEATGH